MKIKSIEKIKTIDDAIWLYAYTVSENMADLRVEAHMKLCKILGIPHSEFKPFESLTIKTLPSQKQAEKMIREEMLKTASKPKSKKLGIEITPTPLKDGEVRCGCCQIKMNIEDARAHFDSSEHLRKSIEISHKIILHNLHFGTPDKPSLSGMPIAIIADKAEIKLMLRGEEI